MRNILSALESASPLDPGKDKAGQLIDKIGSAISLGLLQTGDKLPPENQLSEMLHVSVPTLREALAELRDQGIVETRRGRYGGSFLVGSPLDWRQRGGRLLRQSSVADLRDLGDQAISLLGQSSALACRRASHGDIRRLRDLAHGPQASSDLEGVAMDDSRFHIEVAVVSQSMALTQSAVRMQSRLSPMLWARPTADASAETVHVEHQAIVDAIEQRDPELASRLMEEHLHEAVHQLLAAKLASYRVPENMTPTAAEQAIIAYFGALISRLESEAAALGARIGAPFPPDEPRPSFTGSVLQRSAAVLESFPMAAGAGAIFVVPPDPTSSDCVYWWARNPNGVVERLMLDTVAGTDKFYDIRSQPWFFRARREGRSVLHGPYIDYLGYDQYILTLTAPIRSQAGEFLGIFGADIGVGTVEVDLLPLLLALGREGAVVNDTGRVLVGSSPRWSSGMLLEDAPPAHRSILLEPASLGVRLVFGPS